MKSNSKHNSSPTVVTIGTFDGVHIGHQKIIKRLVTVGKTNKLTPTILTFFPHPRMVLQKDSNIKLINTLTEKKAILKLHGIENVAVNKFTKAFSRLTAKEFVEQILVTQLNTNYVIVGYDHHFGRNRSANISDLKVFGKQYGFEVEEISAQDINSVAVSSTKIRAALANGDLKTANRFLGYPFSILGTVIKGKGLGKTIKFPTANIAITENYKLIPKQGVYIVSANYNNRKLLGMMNIGNNPTVSGKTQTIEVHFFDFNTDIYGEELQINLLDRIRDEKKFDSVKMLVQQLHKDKNFAINYFNDNCTL